MIKIDVILRLVINGYKGKLSMNVLYITENLLANSVYKSQVETLCKQHGKKTNIKLLALCKQSDYTSDYCLDDVEVIKKIRTPLFVIPSVNKLHALFHDLKEIFEWADVIHCRGHGPSLYAINALKKYNLIAPIISDMRAALYEELKYSGSILSRFASKYVLRAEDMIFDSCENFFFVSDNLLEYFSSNYVLPIERCFIFPTFVNSKVFKPLGHSRLDELGISDKKVYVYCGGVSFWQNIDKIILAYDSKTTVDDEYHLLLVVTKPEEIEQLIKTLGVSRLDITVLSSNYEHVAEYIRGCHAGLLIREESVINNVASPTKVFEYISCGIPVILDLNFIGTNKVSLKTGDVNVMDVESASEEQIKIYRELINED